VPPAPPQQSPIRHANKAIDPSLYTLHIVAQTWEEARNICLSEWRSHLVVLNSAEEYAVVKAMWDSNPDFIGATSLNYIFLGLREITENNYITECGKNFHTL
jgi:hypothetical protein